MPFAGYTDFDACVRQNQDKSDPEAYCGAIKHRVEDKMAVLRSLVKSGPHRSPMARGLLWNPQFHRWIKPVRPGALHPRHLETHSQRLTAMARIAQRHLRQANTPAKIGAAREALKNLKAHQQEVQRELQRRGAGLAKQVRDPFAVATATAQEMGYSDFSEGSPGRKKRGEITEALKGESKMVKRGAEALAGLDRLSKSSGCR